MRSKWKIVNLGKYISQQNIRNRGLENIEVYSVTNSNGFTKSTDYFSKEVFSKNLSNYKLVTRTQFAYNPSRINVGSISCLSDTDFALISPLYIVFEVDKDNLFPDYLLRYLKSHYGNVQIRNNTQGSVRDSLKYEGLEKIKIPLPHLDDQIRISALLTRAENLIAKRKESIKALDELLKSTFVDMFGDPVMNEKEWEQKELKSFGQIITGNTPPRSNEDNYSSNFIEWIKTDNIHANKTFLTVATECLSEKGFAKARFVTPGALLVACIAGSVESIGRAAIADRQVSFNQQINAIQPNQKVNPFFMYWLFKVSKLYIQSHATKGMKKILTKGEFEKIVMILPPRHFQDQFAAIAVKVESLKSRFTQSLTELENLYGSLSKRAFKGELDLSGIPVNIEEQTIELHGEANGTSSVAGELFASKIYSEADLSKIIQSLAGESFSFDTLMTDLEKASYDKMPKYEELKEQIYKMLEEPNPLLSQTFDKIKKEIVLRVNI